MLDMPLVYAGDSPDNLEQKDLPKDYSFDVLSLFTAGTSEQYLFQ